MPKKTHRTCFNGRKGQHTKPGNKNPNLTLNRAIVRRDQAQATIDRILQAQKQPETPQPTIQTPSAATPETVPVDEADDYEKRVVVKFYYRELGYPPEEDWSGRDGTIAEIRRRIGASAPSIQMVRRTLTRVAAGDTDVSASKRGGTGRPRILTNVDGSML